MKIYILKLNMQQEKWECDYIFNGNRPFRTDNSRHAVLINNYQDLRKAFGFMKIAAEGRKRVVITPS